MDTITYKGEVYKRISGMWCNDRNIIVHETQQKILNNEYANTIDLSGYGIRDLIDEGDKFRKSSSYALAIRFYEEASKRCGLDDMKYILPRITSC